MATPRPYHPALAFTVDDYGAGKIAVAGCWHENIEWANTAMASARERGAGVLVHTGDFGHLFRAEFIDAMRQLVDKHEMPIMFIDGNRDRQAYLRKLPAAADGSLQLAPGIRYIPRGFRWKWSSVRFLGLGGARSVDRSRRYQDREPSWWASETIQPGDVSLATAHGPVDVLICHDAPSGILIPEFDRYSQGYGDAEILAAQAHRQSLLDVVTVVRPRLIIHGHYHRFYSQTADFGYGPVTVLGLDRDDTSRFRNVFILDMGQVREWVS